MLYSPLVGAHFRPPAKQVLANARANAELKLLPEPDNPYDALAIKVIGRVQDLVPEGLWPQLEQSLFGTGVELEELLSQEELHLGYLISASNKKLEDWTSNVVVGELMSQGPVRARLGFAPDGSPLVRVEAAS